MTWLKVIFTMLLPVYVNAICDECQGNMVACHSETIFSLCLENGTMTYDYIKCPSGSYCTAEKYICYAETENPVISCSATTIVPSTSTITTTPTPTEFDPLSICLNDVTIKSFRDETDPSCQKYYYCSRRDGIVKANKRTCDPGYFNLTSCTDIKPEGCI